jgi:hypothetical protein
MPIRQFLFRHICFYRPQKKTYHILEWCRTKRQWLPTSEVIHANDLRLRKSLNHTVDSVIISIRRRMIQMTCDGSYLSVADYEGRTISSCIPICKKLSDTIFPPSYMKYPTPTPMISTLQHTTVDLWDLVPEPTPPPTPAPISIPGRIAYIIAEASVVKGDVCPITLDELSADTAHVTSCFHVFQGDAIRKWLAKTPTCPVCTTACTAFPTQ